MSKGSRQTRSHAHQLRVGEDVAQLDERVVVRHPEQLRRRRTRSTMVARGRTNVASDSGPLAMPKPVSRVPLHGSAGMAPEKAWLFTLTTPTSSALGEALGARDVAASRSRRPGRSGRR